MIKTISAGCLTLLASALIAQATEFHVATNGADTNPGSSQQPFRTIQHAADIAQPGDVITVHEGVYRERVNPPRGGESDAKRITYQAAPGEKVTITGSEIIKGWEKVGGDTWKVTIPNKFFGSFNPYAELIHGDWFSPNGRSHHLGTVYLDGAWLGEAANLDTVLTPASNTPLWYARADGAPGTTDYVINIAWFKPGTGAQVPAAQSSARQGTQVAPCSEGGQCVGYIHFGDWLRYDSVDFGTGSDSVELRMASLSEVSDIELHLDSVDGELLGTAKATSTGDWQKWASVIAKIKPVSGKHNLCLVIKAPHADTDNTTIWAQFKGVDPNNANVEINVRKTVFTPEKTGVNYITVRGFTLRNAATNWAPPSAGQFGIISANWCRGWIIENNEITCSRCCGVALGKYSDEFDNTNAAGSANPYTECVKRALNNGWNKATVGSHIVRNNRISFCGQTGIVGSMGCAYSTITGNEIHDIHLNQPFSGEEMAGIKFHGAIDVTINGNHIYRCGEYAGIWLDWMAQGARVTRNLMHDNVRDLFCEMQHGPILVDNNLFLSPSRSFYLNAQGIAFAHNLIAGPIEPLHGDDRETPFQVTHGTEIAGMYPSAKGDSGDDRFYNNLFVPPSSLRVMDNSVLPSFAGGNVFTKGAQPSKFDTDALVKPAFDPSVTLTEKPDGWYLTIDEDNTWRNGASRKLVTTELLGRAKVSGEPFENPDGSPLVIDTDYFGNKLDTSNPFPGPFEMTTDGKQTIKIWPKTPNTEIPELSIRGNADRLQRIYTTLIGWAPKGRRFKVLPPSPSDFSPESNLQEFKVPNLPIRFVDKRQILDAGFRSHGWFEFFILDLVGLPWITLGNAMGLKWAIEKLFPRFFCGKWLCFRLNWVCFGFVFWASTE